MNVEEAIAGVLREHTGEFAQVCDCGAAYGHRDRYAHLAHVLVSELGLELA